MHSAVLFVTSLTRSVSFLRQLSIEFVGIFLKNLSGTAAKTIPGKGSDASAASGRESELSEWQRSTDAKALRRRRQMSGTATGQGSNEKRRTVHELSAGTARINDHLG